MALRILTAVGLAFAFAAIVVLPGCSTLERVETVPKDRVTDAEIPGIPAARIFPGASAEAFARLGMESVRRELAAAGGEMKPETMPPAHFLAISGGGENGAFGAGLLVGWTEAGERPEFKLVTGISTGALIAPFAFLGPAYDAQLKEVFTSISKEDIYRNRGLLMGVFSDALADTSPLFGLVAKLADQSMLDAIAAEYAKGRLLLIATTHLDARRPVAWNMGEIAASGDPKALHLFHSILVASAAIPGAFPPVMIDVEVDGKRYQEMHVDGGATAQAFVYPPSLNIRDVAEGAGIKRDRHLYIIRNASLDPDWASTERWTLTIAGRAIGSLIHSQGIGDLYRMYLQAEKDRVDYNLAFIGADFKAEPKEDFDPEYMGQLFDYAYQQARVGYGWKKYPPGYTPDE